MDLNKLLTMTTGGIETVGDDWMPATGIRSMVFEDPGVLWLEKHGTAHGFVPDKNEYSFLEFVWNKGREFEAAFLQNIVGKAVQVCSEPYEVRSVDKVRQTLQHMQAGERVVYQPALWWADAKMYGVPDFLVHVDWLLAQYPDLANKINAILGAVSTSENLRDGYYLVIDTKFTTKLEESRKSVDLRNYSIQLRIYSYMLGKIQGLMPPFGIIVTRDHISDPHLVDIVSTIDTDLDEDIEDLRKTYENIILHGAEYTPWDNDVVNINFGIQDQKWHTAKRIIATERVDGMDTSLLYQIGPNTKDSLAKLGFPNLNSILQADPDNVPFESCKGIGSKKAEKIRAVLQAHRRREAYFPDSFTPRALTAPEFFIDFEYFNNLNVDFQSQWPGLEGKEMIFMIGLGYVTNGDWQFTALTAREESVEGESNLLEDFEALLLNITGNTNTLKAGAFYHWTSPEVWQLRNACVRTCIASSSVLQELPFVDLQMDFRNTPIGLPNCFGYGLKEVATAIGELNEEYKTDWPEELAEGLTAMVMGWRAYEQSEPIKAPEMSILRAYLESDCQSMWNILRWLRSQVQK